jgi:hypothetical protein
MGGFVVAPGRTRPHRVPVADGLRSRGWTGLPSRNKDLRSVVKAIKLRGSLPVPAGCAG